jgi:AraC-like DNA-binding protein
MMSACQNRPPSPPTAAREPVFVRLFESPLFAVGEFRCPGCPTVTDEETALFPEIVIPSEGAYVRRDAGGAVYLDPTVTAFFEPGRPYVIEHLQPKPDVTTVLSILDEGELARSMDMERPVGARFQRDAVRTTPDVHLAHAALLAALDRGAGPLAVEECAVTLICRAVASTQRAFELARSTAAPDRRWRHDIAVATADYLNRHYRRPVQLRDVADHIGYSVFHLCRLFQAEMGKPIHKYLVGLRLQAAVEALSQSDRSITDVAFDLGFSSAGHFAGQFRRWAGISPREARQRVRAGRKISEVFPPSAT